MMTIKTGSRFALSIFAMVTLWVTPAQANDCDEAYGYCMDNANSEKDWWTQEHLFFECEMLYAVCNSQPVTCGDNFCGAGEDIYSCYVDCY
ncbi:hypothetical protein JYK02_10880 [Corallococcus macrosporus]|uniref:Secreted protein n=1 Tax=Corallococcus macrosporus TaxID=35 RepID=A0ABS3DAQ5_9BACT|nr:hypothetical protein [Corallococcus macrosporus]MBN8228012.1 hypothetical protein [Corallococcus macrosporus]